MYWWIPFFDITVSEVGTSIYIAYMKRQKVKWSSHVSPDPFYLSDDLYVLRYTTQGFSYDTKIDGWSVPHNYQPQVDELPLRSPSISMLSDNDGVVVVYPRARPGTWTPSNLLGHEPPYYKAHMSEYGASSVYPTRQFYLKSYKVTPSGNKSLLWTKTDGSYHTPHVIPDGAGAYIVAYSQHQQWDYASNAYVSKIYVDHYNPNDLQDIWETNSISSGSNCSPQLLLTDNGVMIQAKLDKVAIFEFALRV